MTADEVRAFDRFVMLSDEGAVALTGTAAQHRVAKGDFLFQQGAPAGCLVLVASGQIKLEHTAPDGSVVIVDVLGAGNALFFLEPGPCPVTASALSEVEYATLPYQELSVVVRAHPDIALALLRYMAGRLHRAYAGQRAAVRSQVRLADALARIAADSAMSADGAPVVSLSHADLADVAGMARETVTRHLCRWQGQGIVELGLRRIRVRDLTALKRLAEDA